MKKTCHVSSAHSRYDNRIFKKECTSLAKNGYEVWLLINDNEKNELSNGVHIVSTGKIVSGRFQRFTVGLMDIYNKAIDIDADIYHLHDPDLLLIALLLKIKNKKVVYDSHEYYAKQILEKTYIPIMIRRIVSKIYYNIETYVSRRIDAVIVPCTIEKQYSFEQRAKLVGYVPNYAKKVTSNISKKIPRSICYIGGLTKARGIINTVLSGNKCKAKTILAGSFESQEFENSLMGLDVDNSVLYKGFINDSQKLSEVCSQAEIGMCMLLPVGQYNKLTTLPTKVYEYMSLGMPFIMSDFPYNRSFVEKYGVGMLADPENIDDIAEKIKYLFEHKEESEAMGRKGKEIFEKYFSWSVAEKELLKLYEELN